MEPRTDTVSWLATVPTSDVNFKGALERATTHEIRAALDRTRGKPGHATRTRTLEARLRNLQRQAK